VVGVSRARQCLRPVRRRTVV